MLQLQANAAGDQDLSETLNEAASRVNAVGRAYERLAYTADYENIDLIEYLRQIINDLEPTVAPCKIQFDAPEAIEFAADRAILIRLIITELVSNAGKYAYPSRAGGLIWVRISLQTDKPAESNWVLPIEWIEIHVHIQPGPMFLRPVSWFHRKVFGLIPAHLRHRLNSRRN